MSAINWAVPSRRDDWVGVRPGAGRYEVALSRRGPTPEKAGEVAVGERSLLARFNPVGVMSVHRH